MFTADQVVQVVRNWGVTHVVWVPDSVFGRWEAGLEATGIPLIRVCREGEAWPLAAGLQVAGCCPLVMMQTTGFFESGDALRNVVHDLRAPVYAWIGARNWLIPQSPDSARRFARPVLEAWDIDQVWIESAGDLPRLQQHYEQCRRAGRAGMAILAEGAG